MPAQRREPLAREEPAELHVAATNGSIVTDSRGRKYIDFVMGWCGGNFGWRPAAIAKAVERFKGPDYVYPGYAYAPWTELAQLLASLAPRTPWLERIPAKVANRVTLVPVAEIHWIEAADNYVRLHTAEGQYAVRETMNKLAEQLDPRQFARVHRSTIVNLGRVKEMLALPSGDYTVVLEGATRLTLSRGYRKAFEEQIGRALS